MIKQGKLAHVGIAEIREVAASIGKRPHVVARWVKDSRLREAQRWLAENEKWLAGIKANEYYEDVIARMPDGLVTGDDEIDSTFEQLAHGLVKRYQLAADAAKYRRGSRRAAVRRELKH